MTHVFPRSDMALDTPSSQSAEAGATAHTAERQHVGLRTVGVEEEFLLVDAAGGRPVPIAGALMGAMSLPVQSDTEPELVAAVDTELQQEQLETATSPCMEMSRFSDRVDYELTIPVESGQEPYRTPPATPALAALRAAMADGWNCAVEDVGFMGNAGGSPASLPHDVTAAPILPLARSVTRPVSD